MNRAARGAGIALAFALGVGFSAPAATASKRAKAKPSATAAAAPPEPADPREAQREQSAERDRLTARIAELKKQIAAGERSRSGAAAALKRAEAALVVVDRRLDELARRQREGEERIAGLERQRSGTERQIAQRQAAFAATARALDANASQDPTMLYLAGGDPAAPMLADLDLGRVAKAEAAELDALHGRARDLQSQRDQADEDRRALLAQAEAQRSARESLAASQAAQQKTLAQLSQQLAEQRRTAEALAADESRLTRVVEQLQRVIERQAAAERTRREAARRQAEQQAARRQAEQQAARRRGEPAPPVREAPPLPSTEVPDETTGGGAFAQLRGRLRLPVRGTVTGRFGAPRGTGGGTWKGIFVRTDAGADVHAVAAGKVVFAEDLRGFGNLVIVDHGDQYLSIYGNNESLLRHTGDTVRAGDVVARAGSSSGDGETGLYFELRYRGRPFDPLGWSGAR